MILGATRRILLSRCPNNSTDKMQDEKADVDYVEKAYETQSPADNSDRPEQDWTEEEERAIV
jgi:hypothetical protein